jgi:hypothetical protein
MKQRREGWGSLKVKIKFRTNFRTSFKTEFISRIKTKSTGKIVFSLMTSFTGRYQDILYTRRESERGIRR